MSPGSGTRVGSILWKLAGWGNKKEYGGKTRRGRRKYNVALYYEEWEKGAFLFAISSTVIRRQIEFAPLHTKVHAVTAGDGDVTRYGAKTSLKKGSVSEWPNKQTVY